MKHYSYLCVLFLWLTMTVTAQPKHEVRAVWLATVKGLDWPSRYAYNGMGVKEQQEDLCHMLDQLKAANVNTVLFHSRIRATTSYPSELEPWDGSYSGHPGVGPGYDVLRFAIDECHKRGMELHAWVVTIPIGKWNVIGCRELRKKYPSMLRRIGDEGFMNPESGQTAVYLADICEEITRRYDIDGIHLDYIRYPETWPQARSSTEKANRRRNITNIVRCIHDRVKTFKPWVKLSCSPIGKHDDLSRYRSNGWNAYSRVAQDAQAWLRDGLMDQLYPMLYFAGNQFFPFAIDWQEQSAGRSVTAGLGIYMLHPRERNWSLGEVRRQLNVSRQLGLGHCYFRAKFLLDNVKGIYDFVRDFDRHPALVPPMTWEHSQAPSAPTRLDVEYTSTGDKLSWSGAFDNSDSPYLLYNIYASAEEPVDITKAENLIAIRQPCSHISIPRSAGKARLHYAVTAMDRYGNESAPVYQSTGSHAAPAASSWLANDGQNLDLPPYPVDAHLLTIETLQGQTVHTCVPKQQINIGILPEGCYILRTLNRKGITHRIGCFIVKRHR